MSGSPAPTVAAQGREMIDQPYVHAEHVVPGGGAPLLFLFHGTGGTQAQFFGLGRQILPGAGLVAPRGDVSEGGALRYFRRLSEGLYDREDLAARTAKMARFVGMKIAERRPSAVYGLGYSNGANILACVLMGNPSLFSRAVLMHPLIPFEPEAAGSMAGCGVLITAGRRDPICPAPLTRDLADHLGRQGAAVETWWHDGGHEIAQGETDAAAAFLRAEEPGRGSAPGPAA